MMRNDLFKLTCTPAEIKQKTSWIYEQVLKRSPNLKKGNYNAIAATDLKLLFDLYDESFFQGFFQKNHSEKASFRLSQRMTKAAGKTQYFLEEENFVISLSTTLIYQTFHDILREIEVNGVVCHDRLEATMRVFEHEIIHVVESVLFGTTSCSKLPFRRFAFDIFGHTDVTHHLIVQSEIAHKKFNLHVGDKVSFEYEGRTYHGLLNRITKRATVMVRDPEGQYVDFQGKKFTKFYIPLQSLKRAGN